MSLEEWQTRLESHFRDLQSRRALLGIDLPIFGLEHGLSPEEVESIQRDVRAHIAARPPRIQHSLAWVVYSCELGYLYAGDEYWQTFEEATPGWVQYGNRYWLRRIFSQFHKNFSGARPIGRWANHFSIICWPIHHAILPKDLQRHLARTLYQVRHHFSEETLATPLDLGELIKGYSWEANSRFQNLTEEPLLVGQIAAALLLQGTEGFESLIHPATLNRIRQDLEGE